MRRCTWEAVKRLADVTTTLSSTCTRSIQVAKMARLKRAGSPPLVGSSGGNEKPFGDMLSYSEIPSWGIHGEKANNFNMVGQSGLRHSLMLALPPKRAGRNRSPDWGHRLFIPVNTPSMHAISSATPDFIFSSFPPTLPLKDLPEFP